MSSECGMRNAEFQCEVIPGTMLTNSFRIPHSTVHIRL
jgi:hypothetical protein